MTVPTPFLWRLIRQKMRRISSPPGMCFRLWHVMAVRWCRAGHTEAAVDLSRLAGLYPAGVICEIMNDDGTIARLPDLVKFAQLHGFEARHDCRPYCLPPQK